MSYEVALGSKMDPLIGDNRVEAVFCQLQKLKTFPDDTAFTTAIAEPNDKEPRRLALFVVTSKHPRQNKRAISAQQLITVTAMPYEKWVEKEKEYRHYAGLSDPIRPIFAGLLRRHINHYNNLRELN